MGFSELDNIREILRRIQKIEVTEEMKDRARKSVCGHRSVRDASDAKELLEALGLIGEVDLT